MPRANGIYRRGSTWWYQITIKGVTHRGTCKTADENLAREYRATKERELWRAGMLNEQPRRTWSQARERWLSENMQKKSRRDDARYAAWWSEAFKAAKIEYLDDITADAVKPIVDQAMKAKAVRRDNTTKPATMNRRLAFLRTVINAANRVYGWLDKQPLFKMVPGETERRRFLTTDEVHRLRDALPEPYKSMAMLSVATGLRRNNILRLRWSYIDFQRAVATFPDIVMKNGLSFSVPLTDAAMAIIRPWIGRHREFVFVRPVLGGFQSQEVLDQYGGEPRPRSLPASGGRPPRQPDFATCDSTICVTPGPRSFVRTVLAWTSSRNSAAGRHRAWSSGTRT